jgi:hypothetical protein
MSKKPASANRLWAFFVYWRSVIFVDSQVKWGYYWGYMMSGGIENTPKLS